MKKIILLSMLFSFPALANTIDEDRTVGIMKSNLEQMSDLSDVGVMPVSCTSINEQQSEELPGLSENFFDNGIDCRKFIDDDGDYGEWGVTVQDYIHTSDDKNIYLGDTLKGMGPPDLICPNWSNLSVDEKKHFWVWTIAAISWKESSCDSKARNSNASNGVAVGLLQLDEGTKNRAWRGQNCKVKKVTGASDNIKCGLDILTEILKAEDGDYRSNGLLYGKKNNSYWQDLKKVKGGKIGTLIRSYPPCHK